MTYNTIPVDDETYTMVKALCVAYEMGKRGHGALVKKVIKAEYEKLAAVKMVAPIDVLKSDVQAAEARA